jgi:hypothetical protein
VERGVRVLVSQRPRKAGIVLPIPHLDERFWRGVSIPSKCTQEMNVRFPDSAFAKALVLR